MAVVCAGLCVVADTRDGGAAQRQAEAGTKNSPVDVRWWGRVFSNFAKSMCLDAFTSVSLTLTALTMVVDTYPDRNLTRC